MKKNTLLLALAFSVCMLAVGCKNSTDVAQVKKVENPEMFHQVNQVETLKKTEIALDELPFSSTSGDYIFMGSTDEYVYLDRLQDNTYNIFCYDIKTVSYTHLTLPTN